MQNNSVLSKPKMMIDNRRLPHWSVGEQRRESSGTAHEKSYELHSQASATHFLICLPSPWCLGHQGQQGGLGHSTHGLMDSECKVTYLSSLVIIQ